MHLKRLELKGFKSFPNKTDVLFNEGITAIVGPNGSGKSNISDAVRWVLGEQSIKSLRGDKLEDVVFAGTDTKKAMNYCEVALTIDNSDRNLNIDFSEITIKRRAYRSGESQFFLNNKPCRLKDIKELLLDTGIGKDGYSIIEQGKVDEILSNNPTNRRKVFDEACGISKFRYKKQEAERNLKHTKENLSRIEDVYIEIENQLKPLEVQQEKATKYIEIKEALKKIEVNSYIKEIETLDLEINESTNHSYLLKDQIDSINKNKEAMESSINTLNEDLENIDKAINKTIEYTNTIKGVIGNKYSELSLLKEKIRNCDNEIERNSKELSEIKESLNLNEKSLDQLKYNKNNKEEQIKLLELDINNIESNNFEKKSNIENINKNIENLKDEIINLLNSKQDNMSKLSTLNANIDNINIRKENIRFEIENIEKNKSTKFNEIKSYENDKIEKVALINELKNNAIKLNSEINNLRDEYKIIEGNIQNSKLKLNEYKSKVNVYIDMENHYEGFNKGVKEVLRNKSLNGIHGALGQIISSTQKYEKALEAVLGSYLQNVITIDENSAKVAINYLKKNNLGRVTFLPLNVIKSNKIDVNYIKSSTKFIGIASDLVSFDNQYKNIVENVLGRTIVIEDMEQAIKFARETNHKYKVVTLDGEILNPGGSLTGGTLRTSGNILSRKRLIEEFKEKIENQKLVIENLEAKKMKVNNLANEITNKIENNNDTLNKNEKLLVVIEANIKNITEELNNLENSINKLESEEVGLKENLDYTLEKTKTIKDGIKEIENKHNLNKENIDNLNNKLKESNDSYENDKVKFDNLNLEYVKEKQIYEGLTKDIERIAKDIQNQKNRVVTIENELNNNKLDKVKLEDQIKIDLSEKENLENQLMDENKKLANERQQKDSMKTKYEELSNKLKNINRQYMQVKESLFKVENKLERLENSQDTYINKLVEEYELTLAEAMNLKDETIDIDKKVLDSLKKSIRSLGNVNLDSIEEYKEIKERYDFYSEQKKDLEESIEIIEKLIEDLQDNMNKEFKTNFEIINKNFKAVYKRLFGGGNGELIIVDKKNILESDIEIVAQPPGKKMKNLNLLSGGEKALTAISILFAILLAKPTPFCILDEIEAPLDDANIFRFGEFLKELAKDTQFISITHRRGTMEAADYIYGVTMQEKAISKVISLKLQEAKELTKDII